MSSGSIRIIQLPEKSSVNTDDYMAVDSSANGTKKVKFTDLLDDNLSVQNKAADAQATGQAISELNTDINNTNTRIDNMINTQQNAEVTTLWTGTLNTIGGSVTLSKSVSNFDFLDFYTSNGTFERVPVSAGTLKICETNIDDNGLSAFQQTGEAMITFSGTTVTLTSAYIWDYASTGTVTISSGIVSNIKRIDGVKIGHIENDEIIDARVGANGTTYPTLGDAIRGQVTDLKADINHLPISQIYDDYIPQTFILGAIKSVGSPDTSTTRIRTQDFLNTNNLGEISTDGNQLALYAYSSDATAPTANAFIGGWSGSAFGTASYVSSINIASIVASYPTYKLILVIRYADNRTISDINALLSTVKFNSNKKLSDVLDDIKEGGAETVAIPFSFPISFTLTKAKNGYDTDIVPQKYAYTNNSGVTVFISPTGDDSNSGLTVIAPKRTIEGALAVSDVATILFLEGVYESGTHFTSALTINTPINMIGIGEVVIHNNDYPMIITDQVYMANMIFEGGKNNTLTINHASGVYAVFDNCTFRKSKYYNGVSINGGYAVLKNCKAYGNAYDGFNYHANDNVVAYVLEIDCESFDNGHTSFSLEQGQSSNATTSHDGCPVIRVNGNYYACHGGVVADKDCNSANYGCKAGVSTITDSANYPDRMSNYWSSGSNMYLYDCISYGSKYDTAVIRSGSITSNVTYDSNYSA